LSPIPLCYGRVVQTQLDTNGGRCDGVLRSGDKQDMSLLLIHKHQGYGLIAVALIAQLEAIRSLPAR
jgi:hypothetical protein